MENFELQRDFELESVVGDLKNAILSFQMYPKGTPIIQDTVTRAFTSISQYVKAQGEIIFNDAELQLWKRMKVVLRIKGFRELMARQKIRNIKIDPKVTRVEIGFLCEGMAKVDTFKEHKSFMNYLISVGVKNIQTDEVLFVDMGDGQDVVYRVNGMVSQHYQDAETLINSVEESLKLLERIQNEDTLHDVRSRLIQKIAGSSPDILKELYENQENPQLNEIMDGVTQNLDKKKLEEMVNQIVTWQQKVKVEVSSPEQAKEKTNQLQSLLKKVLRSPASQELSPQLYSYLRSLGLLDHVGGGGFAPGETFSFHAVSDNLLELPPEFLLNNPLRDNLFSLIKNMCTRGQDEAMEKLIQHMLKNFDHETPKIRTSAGYAAIEIQKILTANRKDAIWDRFAERLFEELDTEDKQEVYEILADGMLQTSLSRLLRWQFDPVVQVLKRFRLHAYEDFHPMPVRREIAHGVLKKFAQKSVETLGSDLRSGVLERQDGASRVLAELGEEAAEILIETLKMTEEPRTIQLLIQTLEALGKPARHVLKQQLDVRMSGDILSRYIALYAPLATLSDIPQLATLLSHPDAQVRRNVVRILARFWDTKMSKVYMGLLQDPDHEVQRLAVAQLAEHHTAEALPLFLQKLPEATTLVQEEICLALGQLRDPKTVGVLLNCLSGKQGFLSGKYRFPEGVRARAAWSLGQFIDQKKVQHALVAAQKDPSHLVQQAVSHLLNPPENSQAA